MFAYNLRLALLSIRNNPILSALMVAAIAIGIGICMTALTVYYLMSNNPIPHKSDRLFAVQIDAYDVNEPFEINMPERPPTHLTWKDSMALMESNIPTHHTAMFNAVYTIDTDDRDVAPFQALTRMTGNDFFALFDVPFLYGGPWSEEADREASQVVVIDRATNDKIFGGEDSTGREVRMNNRYFKIAGVIDDWLPSPKFYDLTSGSFDEPESMFMPISLTPALDPSRSGHTSCWKVEDTETFEAYLNSECIWLLYWAQLDDAGQRAEYMDYLNAYAAEQKELGRHERPVNNWLSNVDEWMARYSVVSNDNRVLVGLAFMFLAVCLLNTIGLLLAKFTGKAPRIGLQRALGASKMMIFRQNLVEVGLIGLAGGLFGLGLAWIGLRGVQWLSEGEYDRLVNLDTTMIVSAFVIALVASLIAGLYPTWRICQIAPANYLKTQ